MFSPDLFKFNPVTCRIPARDPMVLHAGESVSCYIQKHAEYAEVGLLKSSVETIDAFYNPIYSNRGVWGKIQMSFLRDLPFLRPNLVRIAEREVLRIKEFCVTNLNAEILLSNVESVRTNIISNERDDSIKRQILKAYDDLKMSIISVVGYKAYFSVTKDNNFIMFSSGVEGLLDGETLDSSTTIKIGRRWIRTVFLDLRDDVERAKIARPFRELVNLLEQSNPK